MKRTPWLPALAGLVLLVLAAWWWQRGPGAPASRAVVGGAAAGTGPGAGAPDASRPAAALAVELATVQVQPLEETAQAVGSLRAAQSVMLRPEVGGRIVRLGVRDGQAVRQGQLLVQLDDSVQRAQLAQAEAQAAVARSTHRRNTELVDQGFITRSGADQSAAALAVAEAQLALARAELARMRLLAPFDGRAGLRLVDVGAVVQPGTDLLPLEDSRSLEVEFRLPERALSRLQPGQPLSVVLDAWPGPPQAARITALGAEVEADGRAVAVRARLERPAPGLKPGMFARVSVVLARRDAALTVPEEAVVPQDGRLSLVTVGPAGADGLRRTRRVAIETGLRAAGRVEVRGEGLTAGTEVVRAGPARLMRADGLAVRAVQLASAEAGAPPASAPPTARPAAR